MAKKKMTIDGLARMTKRGLDELASNMEKGFKETPSKGELWELRHEMKEGFRALREDIKEI